MISTSIIPVIDFAYARSAEKGAKALLGLKLRTGRRDEHSVEWFAIGAGKAKAIGRALLTMIDEKPEPFDHVLDQFRAARNACRRGGLTPQDAAARHGIDAELLVAWMARL